MANIEKLLRDAIEKKQNAANQEDTKMMAQELSRELASQMNIDELSGSVQRKITESLLPIMVKLVERDQMSSDTISKAVREAIKEIKIPETKIPDFPAIPAPRVKVPAPVVNIPETVFPNEMDVRGWVQLMMNDTPVGMNNPLAVTLRNADGSPMDLLANLTTVVGGSGGGGGKSDFFTIKGYSQSAFSELQNADGRVRVSVETSSSGLTDSELRASSVPVAQASGAVWSTEVTDIFGSTVTSDVINSDNRIRVSVETGGSGLTDAELRASSVPVAQASGAVWSTEVTNTVTVDGSGVTQPVSGTVAVSSISNSTASALVDSSGVQYSGSNPVPVTDSGAQTDALTDTELRAMSVPVAQVSGATWSTEVTNTVTVDLGANNDIQGDVAHDTADSGNPVKIGGVARTANPTAVANGDRVDSFHDDVGRAVVRPVQVRDLLQTAYVEASSEGEKTLLAGAAGVYHDLVYMMAANSSDAAITLDIRQTTGGTVQSTLEVPANATAGLALGGATLPQDHADATWTVDNNSADASNTTYAVTALFSKEV